MLHHTTLLIKIHQRIMVLQLKHTRLKDACASSSSWEIQEDFSNVKRYSTELTRQSIWSLQKSFRPSFCWVWENGYFPCFLAHWPSHLLTSGSSLNPVCTREYLLGNKLEGSSDSTNLESWAFFIHMDRISTSDLVPTYLPLVLIFFQSGYLSFFFTTISFIS